MPLSASDTIVLIHGIAAKRLVMWPLAYRLRAEGFKVHSWRYPSLFSSIASHAARLHDFLINDLYDERCVHIVAHSMGSIITRSALARGLPHNLGRIVLLAPPNAGSPVARIASSVLGRVIPPTRELSDDSESLVHQIGFNEKLSVGILAARYDFLVPEKNTHLTGELEHRTLVATHNSLLFSSKVVAMTANFLRYGTFDSKETG